MTLNAKEKCPIWKHTLVWFALTGLNSHGIFGTKLECSVASFHTVSGTFWKATTDLTIGEIVENKTVPNLTLSSKQE